VIVTCDPRDRTDAAKLAKSHPRFVSEVLSPSTGAYDRGRKFELYQGIPELQEYLLIEQDRQHADLFRKNAEGFWVLHPIGASDIIELTSLDIRLQLADLYEDVDFAPNGGANF
jgi:Uma2 family endonuclease